METNVCKILVGIPEGKLPFRSLGMDKTLQNSYSNELNFRVMFNEFTVDYFVMAI
jgi:hypothetical protein